MGNPSLTKIMFAALVGTFAIATMFGTYSSFAILNNSSIQEPYKSAMQNISLQYTSLSAVSQQAGNQSLVTNVFNFGTTVIAGTVNVFVVGLDAMGKFFNMLPLIGNILSAIDSALPGFSGLIALITTLIFLYIPMRYIQSVSNKFELP